MPEGFRNGTVAVGLAVLLVVIAWSVFIWHLGAYQQRHREGNQQQAYANTGPTDPELYNLCLSRSPSATVECIRQYVEASSDAQHAEKDLKAQQQMADWTLLMTWASGAGVLVTAIGVIYIAATLVPTRKATQAAIDAVDVTREIGEAQVRGYLLVKSVTANINDWGRLEIAVEVENTGLSPLLGVQVYFLIRLVTPEKEQVLISDFGYNGRSLKVVKMMHLRPRMPQDYVRTFDLKGAENSWLNADDTCAAVVEVDLITLAGDVFGRNIYGHERWGLNDEIRGAHAQMRLKNVYATSIDRIDRFEWHGIQIGQMWPLAVDQHR